LGLGWFRDFVHARIKRPLDHLYGARLGARGSFE
jgi:hypothetical protein